MTSWILGALLLVSCGRTAEVAVKNDRNETIFDIVLGDINFGYSGIKSSGLASGNKTEYKRIIPGDSITFKYIYVTSPDTQEGPQTHLKIEACRQTIYVSSTTQEARCD